MHSTRLSRSLAPLLAAAATIFQSGCGGSASKTPISHAGTVTALLSSEYAGNWPTGLDPGSSTTAAANISMMNAIFDGLFDLVADDDGRNPRVAPSLAKAGEISADGRTLTVHLREGVRFSDGTSFDAEAVKFNLLRDLQSPCSCSPTRWPWATEDPVAVADNYTVVLNFAQPYAAAALNAFPASNINWIVSPTALRVMGPSAFKLHPVGAGAFVVVSDEMSARLVLSRNGSYWNPHRPFLDHLIFESVGSESAAYLALLSGSAQVVEGVTSTPLIAEAQRDGRISVTRQPGTSPYVVQLNTSVAPFNDKRAREAVYYATNVEAIRNGIFNGWYPPSETFTAPGGLFHHARVEGYREYDLARARSLVTELGGLTVNLGTLKAQSAVQVITALQTQWRQAGMSVTIDSYNVGALVQQFKSGHWQAMLQTAGSYDPEAGSGVSIRFESNQLLSGVHDAALDELLSRAADEADPRRRDADYRSASEYISNNAYAPFLFAFAPAQFSVHGLSGPGLTTKIPPILVNTGISWKDVRWTMK